jgi:MFS family permease
MVYIRNEKAVAATQEPFDWAGALLFSLGLVALLFGLNNGETWGWTSPAILGCLIGAVIFLAAFLRVEMRAKAPMLDLSLFRKRIFAASTASAMLNYIGQSCVLFLIPFYLIQGRGFNTAEAGLILTSQPVIMALSAPVSGLLSDRIGSRVLSTVGLIIMAVGLFLLSRLGPDSSRWMMVIYLVIEGLGTGIFISPNNSALLGSAPRQRQGIASGILATARNVGMVLGIGLAGAVFSIVTTQQGDAGIYAAVQLGLLIAAGIALLGAVISFSRGTELRSK